MKRYRYVGPGHIIEQVSGQPPGFKISSKRDVLRWISASHQRGEQIIATYTINLDGHLYLADRHTEHLACAQSLEVLAAGEIFLLIDKNDIEIEEISNLSTGYCPEPESWKAVERALDSASIKRPGKFTIEIIFRRCVQKGCGMRNIVKDDWFECQVCGRELPKRWNFDD